MIDSQAIQAVLKSKASIPIHDVHISPLQGDASNRSYYRLRLIGTDHPLSMVLMVLADPEEFKASEERASQNKLDITELPFITILNLLDQAQVSVPKLYHYEKSKGWLFLQDLGDETLEKAIQTRDQAFTIAVYQKAIRELIKIQRIEGPNSEEECLAFKRAFDVDLYMWEFDHFLEYGPAHLSGQAPSGADLLEIRNEFEKISRILASLPLALTHRDYHSRNLLYRDNRLWVLDFQDALMGPHVYDLASLLRDSYATLGESHLDAMLTYYQELSGFMRKSLKGLPGFRQIFDLVSIQRNLKAIGRFVYIDRVKKNPRFLQYIPRTLSHVRRNLEAYPELSPLRKSLIPYLEGPGNP